MTPSINDVNIIARRVLDGYRIIGSLSSAGPYFTVELMHKGRCVSQVAQTPDYALALAAVAAQERNKCQPSF